MIKELPIQIDTREKKGHELLFPAHLTYMWRGKIRSAKVTTERVTLPEGDYACSTLPEAVGIERKGSLRELHTNFLTDDRDRARAAFIRFSNAFETPVVLAHVSYKDFRPNFRIGGLVLPGHQVFDSLSRLCLELGLHLWMCGPCRSIGDRRQLGTLVARLFLQRRLNDE